MRKGKRQRSNHDQANDQTDFESAAHAHPQNKKMLKI
jgi:hypothetical protein